jgi:hypothetical protein
LQRKRIRGKLGHPLANLNFERVFVFAEFGVNDDPAAFAASFLST